MLNLILSGGPLHPFRETSSMVASILAAEGVHSQVSDVGDGLARLRDERFDLVTVNALAWSMTQHEKYAASRDRFAFSIAPEDRQAILSHLECGGGLLGLHSAPICFDDWPDWPAILGAGWRWGRSNHPAPDYLQVSWAGKDISVWDELYCDLTIGHDVEVHATAVGGGITSEQPVLTTRRERTGAVAYLALGHDLTSVTHPGYGQLLRHAARLALDYPGNKADAGY